MAGENYLGPGWFQPARVGIASKLTEPQWRLLRIIAASDGPPAQPFGMTSLAALLRHELVTERDGIPVLTDLGGDVLAEADGEAPPSFTPD
ncbi:hypothetical protein [Roseococcus pinisoli]|uniref:MarR family transcriptional regulator n=1 Tax=Roseococcus pinisoli TaxID=2835040 RepID=A0ABS5QGP8_9PROT|nr:hypothetical protein [Roseococcus pinisoli]MBS7812851.1 hypothetical protein [Roseococcus pinisoli]